MTKTKPQTKGAFSKAQTKAQTKALTAVFKKKRNTEPGIRHQGGRIYDSENGTSCHQCRQKTLEVKAGCKSCTLHFCPRCLSNRYNEEVDYVRHLPKWDCPKCRNICNCSNCRKKQGLQATGILANIAKSAGFGSVSQLLEKNPNVSVMSLSTKKNDDKKIKTKGRKNNGDREKGARGIVKKGVVKRGSKENSQRNKSGQTGKGDGAPGDENTFAATSAKATGYSGVDDASLKKRFRSLPAPVEPKIHSEGDSVDIPVGLDTVKLICALEFFSTFAGAIGLDDLSITGLAKDLLRTDAPGEALQGNGHVSSPLIDALVALKRIICNWFGGDEVDADGLAWDTWLATRYMAGSGLPVGPNASHRPPKSPRNSVTNAKRLIATGFFALGRRVKVLWEGESGWFPGVVRKVDRKGRVFVVYDDGDESWEDVNNPERFEFDDQRTGPTFWSWAIADRLEAVDMVIHEAIQCGPIVDVIEKSVEDIGDANRRHKEEIERVKRDINEEKERYKQRFIAELISSQQISNISVEKQQEIVANARLNASSKVSVENLSRLRWLKTSQFLRNCSGRTVAVGEDRTGLSYYLLGCAEIVTGSSQGLVCLSEDSIKCFGDAETRRIVEALDVSGEKEGALRMGLEFSLTMDR